MTELFLIIRMAIPDEKFLANQHAQGWCSDFGIIYLWNSDNLTTSDRFEPYLPAYDDVHVNVVPTGCQMLTVRAYE